MLRRLAVGCVLILCGGMVAGCGGASLQQATRQEARDFLGNGHPKILRIETARDLSGSRLVVATIEGHFKPVVVSCGLGPCRPWPPNSYVWLSFSQPSGRRGFQTTSASQITEINNAHSADPMFGIFPYSAATAIQCAIPKGNSSGTFAGSCSTTVIGTLDHPREIRFHEAWSFARTSLGYSHQKADGGWIVSLDRNERVQSIRQFGDLPPQLWR